MNISLLVTLLASSFPNVNAVQDIPQITAGVQAISLEASDTAQVDRTEIPKEASIKVIELKPTNITVVRNQKIIDTNEQGTSSQALASSGNSSNLDNLTDSIPSNQALETLE
jgi:hypothetical protein